MATEDMANQEVGGHRGKIFNIGAPPKETPTVNVPKSKPEVDISPKRPKRERRRLATGEKIKKGLEIVRNATLAGVAVGSFGLATQHHVEYQEPLSPQGIALDFGSIPSTAVKDYNWLIQKIHPKPVPIVPEAFNNKDTDIQYVRAGINATPITDNDLPSLSKDIKPLAKNSFPDITVPMFIKLDNNQTIEISTKYVEGVVNPYTLEPELLPVGKKFIIPKAGTEIGIPVEGAEIFKLTPYDVGGKPYFNGAVVQFFGPDGTRFEFFFQSPSDVRQLVPMDAIEGASTVAAIDFIKHNPNVQKGKGLSLPLATSFLKTGQDNANVEVSLDFYPPEFPKGAASDFSLTVNDQGKLLFLPNN